MSTPTDPTTSSSRAAAWQRLGDELPPAPTAAEQQDVLWQEFQAQFRWYNRAATRTRRGYAVLKVISLAVAAAVPVLAAIQARPALTASLAAAVVIVEGLVQLFQLQTNWISYRATAEALRQHGFLYAAHVEPYGDPKTRRERLAACLRDATTKENTVWASTMRQAVPAPRDNPGSTPELSAMLVTLTRRGARPIGRCTRHGGLVVS